MDWLRRNVAILALAGAVIASWVSVKTDIADLKARVEEQMDVLDYMEQVVIERTPVPNASRRNQTDK